MITCRDSDIGKHVSSPDDVVRLLLPLMLTDRETLAVLCLDERRNVITARRVAIGTADSVSCDPRLVFRPAILADATFILIAHNHPSGNPTPSLPDIETTKVIEIGAALLGIVFIDHLVLTTSGRYRSIAEYTEKGF
jgi:DNA repair protein RadC